MAYFIVDIHTHLIFTRKQMTLIKAIKMILEYFEIFIACNNVNE